MPFQDAETQAVLQRIERDRSRYLDELIEYLRIPSISSDPAHRAEIQRAADFIDDKLRQAGLESRLIATDGNPLVYAEWRGAPGRPTILFYGHYDVQPPDPIELWRNPPFEPALEGGRLIARGATDDKGQSYTHVKAVEAVLAERGSLPVNVKFILEGEEECGGESIEAYVLSDAGQAQLACDAVFISDSAMFAPGQPSLLYGLRGLVYMEIKVTGPERDLHSGTFGGAVSNPLNALGHIVASLRDADSGKVLIPGFYDAVRPLEPWEKEEHEALDFDEAAYRADLGVPELHGESGFSTLERVWARPSLDVNGLFGGYSGPGPKTVLPSWGGAKVSMRLVPDQDPAAIARQLERLVQEVAPRGVTVETICHQTAKPVLIEPRGRIVAAAMEAMAEVWRTPVRVREGGTIPIVSTFNERLGVPILLIGFGLPDDRLHSPNEKLDLENFFNGIRAVVGFLDRLGRDDAR